MIQVVLVGGDGRMGRAIQRAAEASEDVQVVARVGRARAERLGVSGARRESSGYQAQDATPSDSLADLVQPGHVVVEFSTPEGFRRAVAACRERGVPLVSGTTGLSDSDEAELGGLSKRVAVLRASNFSLGMLALRRAMEAALAGLPGHWEIEIVERHHRGKADSPSGSALALARVAAAARGWSEPPLVHGRQGRRGPRPEREIGMHAVRGGTWVGDHTVLLAGDGESLELRHVAQDRGPFAHGALAAARFVSTAAPGRYDLSNILTASGRDGGRNR